MDLSGHEKSGRTGGNAQNIRVIGMKRMWQYADYTWKRAIRRLAYKTLMITWLNEVLLTVTLDCISTALSRAGRDYAKTESGSCSISFRFGAKSSMTSRLQQEQRLSITCIIGTIP